MPSWFTSSSSSIPTAAATYDEPANSDKGSLNSIICPGSTVGSTVMVEVLLSLKVNWKWFIVYPRLFLYLMISPPSHFVWVSNFVIHIVMLWKNRFYFL